ncbi:hypothetical protein N7540_011801 [Penicillium herquei]|nr:hypothetical protein N7540_011801 [Penicillium herquei]
MLLKGLFNLEKWMLGLLLTEASASIILEDPSDIIPSTEWAADNAVKANYNDTSTVIAIPLTARHIFKGEQGVIHDQSLYHDHNDSSVLLVTDHSSVQMRRSKITKFGSCSSLNEASFYGLNAAVLVANHSHASLSEVNITTHNGAANVYSYGTKNVVEVSGAWLYSSGPTAHGLYAGGNGTIIARDVVHYSGGNRCSSFAGDSPVGYLSITNSRSRTDGIGSAIAFIVGETNFTDVIGHASNAPGIFHLTGRGKIKNSDLAAGLLGGAVFFGLGGSDLLELDLEDSKLSVTTQTAPTLWFGATNAKVTVIRSQLTAESGILVIANRSTITQDFDHYSGYNDNPTIQPARAVIKVEESSLAGDIVSSNNSTLTLNLTRNSFWAGMAKVGQGNAQLGVSLDATSIWNLTGPTHLENFTNANPSHANVHSNGFSIYYNPKATTNKPLHGKSVELPGGGWLKPSQRFHR